MKRYVRSDAGNRPEKNRRGVPGESEAARRVHRPGNERFRSIATPRLTQIPALLHSLLWIVDSGEPVGMGFAITIPDEGA